MSAGQELAVGDLHAGDIGRITRIVDASDKRREVVGKLIGVQHALIGTDLHTTLTVEYSSHGEAITLFVPSSSKLLFGPPIASRAELIS